MICLFEMAEISQLWGAKTLETVGFTRHMASSLTKKKGDFLFHFSPARIPLIWNLAQLQFAFTCTREKRSSFSPLPFLLTTPNLVNSSFMSCHKTRINTQHYSGMPKEPGTLSFG